MMEGDRQIVAGVMSLADAYCEWQTFCVRTDVHLAWLMGQIEQHDPDGLPDECGDGMCEYLEKAEACPEDCSVGKALLGEECGETAECASNLFCLDATEESTSVCSGWCSAPGTGAGCPCGFICDAGPNPEDPGKGVCRPLGALSSNCGNGWCEAGEDFALCAADCTVPVCNDVGPAGCCHDGIATWCAEETLHQEHCGLLPECGWDAELGRYACGTEGGPDPEGLSPQECPAPGPLCGNGLCEAGEDQESCALDCLYPGFCGDGECNGTEDFKRCPEDCRKEICHVLPVKGCCDGEVAVWCYESDLQMVSCEHHPSCGWDPANGGYGCGTDGSEDPTGELPRDCTAYLATVCGDGECDDEEDHVSCPDDCEPPPPGCGDGECGPGEDYTLCPDDCFLNGCGKVLEAGCCDGDVVKSCIGGALFMVNCSEEPMCGWSEEDGYYWCGTEGSPEPSGIHAQDCADVAAAHCGDGICQADENKYSCQEDCMPAPEVECGDGVCEEPESNETCPQDCVPPVEPNVVEESGAEQEIVAAEPEEDVTAVEEMEVKKKKSGSCGVASQSFGPGALMLLLALLLLVAWRSRMTCARTASCEPARKP